MASFVFDALPSEKRPDDSIATKNTNAVSTASVMHVFLNRIYFPPDRISFGRSLSGSPQRSRIVLLLTIVVGLLRRTIARREKIFGTLSQLHRNLCTLKNDGYTEKAGAIAPAFSTAI